MSRSATSDRSRARASCWRRVAMSHAKSIPLGPVVIDVVGKELSDDDRRRLLHPLTGGVILFTRNYESPEQLQRLTSEIHELREPALIVSVDHEGGRVQRFRQG